MRVGVRGKDASGHWTSPLGHDVKPQPGNDAVLDVNWNEIWVRGFGLSGQKGPLMAAKTSGYQDI